MCLFCTVLSWSCFHCRILLWAFLSSCEAQSRKSSTGLSTCMISIKMDISLKRYVPSNREMSCHISTFYIKVISRQEFLSQLLLVVQSLFVHDVQVLRYSSLRYLLLLQIIWKKLRQWGLWSSQSNSKIVSLHFPNVETLSAKGMWIYFLFLCNFGELTLFRVS